MMASSQYGSTTSTTSTTSTSGTFYPCANNDDDDYYEIVLVEAPRTDPFWWPFKYREGLMWKKLIAIKGWFLIIPAVAVLAWGALKLIGRVFVSSREAGPQLNRYLTREQQEAEAVRINRQREVDREADDRVVAGTRDEH